jgi:hypothetical protein
MIHLAEIAFGDSPSVESGLRPFRPARMQLQEIELYSIIELLPTNKMLDFPGTPPKGATFARYGGHYSVDRGYRAASFAFDRWLN